MKARVEPRFTKDENGVERLVEMSIVPDANGSFDIDLNALIATKKEISIKHDAYEYLNRYINITGGLKENALELYSTKQLVEELTKRAEVERIDVAPHTQVVEVSVRENKWFKYVYNKMDSGPAVILWIID